MYDIKGKLSDCQIIYNSVNEKSNLYHKTTYQAKPTEQLQEDTPTE